MIASVKGDTFSDMDVVAWLLDSDPAVRWQAMRDLTDASPATIASERARVAHEGLGAKILAAQGADGAFHLEGKPTWLPTLFMPLLLRFTGVDPTDAKVASATSRLAEGFHWPEEHGAHAFFDGETEPCINGHTLTLGAYFGRPSRSLARRLLADQFADGGWNCDAPKSAVSSFDSTVCVLEGLLELEHAVGGDGDIAAARRRGEEYLLQRALFRRRSTGEVASEKFLKPAFPPRYHYDVLRALEYFRAAGVRDARMDEAVAVLESKRTVDGVWNLERTQQESLSLQLDERVGEPSRWITLRAMRVLRWYRDRV